MNDNSTASPAVNAVQGRIGDNSQAGPMAYMTPDPLPPPWYWATDFYRRKRRSPRCEGKEG